MSDHPDDEKLDDSYAAMTQATRRRQWVGVIETSLIAGAAVLISISTVFSAWNTFELRKLAQEGIQTREIILLGTECIVQQLSEHRHLTGLAHRAGADHHGYVYPIPPESEPAVVPELLANVCGIFLHTTTTSRP